MNSTNSLLSAALVMTLASSVFAQKPVFTETFESGKLNADVWDRRVEGAATIAVEPVDGAHGKFALHAHYPDMERGSYAFAVATHLPDSVRKHFFGRAYVKIAPAIAKSHTPLLFAGENGWPLSKFDEIGGSNGNFMPSFQENKSARGQGRGEVTVHSDTPPPADKWFLLEWEFNDDPSSITLWLDGEKVMDSVDGQKVDVANFAWPKGSPNVSNLVGGFTEFGFGVRVWGTPAKAFDVYYDDIAIGTSRLGPVK